MERENVTEEVRVKLVFRHISTKRLFGAEFMENVDEGSHQRGKSNAVSNKIHPLWCPP